MRLIKVNNSVCMDEKKYILTYIFETDTEAMGNRNISSNKHVITMHIHSLDNKFQNIYTTRDYCTKLYN